MNIAETFEKYEDEHGEFERIQNPRSGRPDLCAFLILDNLIAGTSKIISDAEHDEIFLDTSIEALSFVATEAHIIALVRCGVRYSEEFDCLCMFV